VSETRSPRKNTGIILGRSSTGRLHEPDPESVEPSEANPPAPEKCDLVKNRIRHFEEQAQLASQVKVHLARMNRQPARRTRSEQAGSPVTSKPAPRAPTKADAAEKPDRHSRKIEKFS